VWHHADLQSLNFIVSEHLHHFVGYNKKNILFFQMLCGEKIVDVKVIEMKTVFGEYVLQFDIWDTCAWSYNISM